VQDVAFYFVLEKPCWSESFCRSIF